MVTLISRDPSTNQHKLIRKKPSRHALQALAEFEAAAADLAFIGSMDPECHDEIRDNYNKAKKRIIKHLSK